MMETKIVTPEFTSVVTETPAVPPVTAADANSTGWARQIADNASEAWSNMAMAADAQINIWSMKLVRMLVLAALGIPMLIAAVALIVYGFVLLDRAFDIALQWPDFPHWVSPVVRGGIYFGLPMIALAVVWFTTIGTSSSTPRAEASKEGSHA